MTLLDGTRAPVSRLARTIRYRDVLREPHAIPLLLGALVGRLPTGMAPLAILLYTDHGVRGGSPAGLLAAVYLAANALGGPLNGRLVDRHGPRPVLSFGAAVSSTSLLALTAGPDQTWWAIATVTFAGAARPPLDAALRTLWGARSVMPSPAHQRVAMALESGAQELIYIIGPLLVVAITATTSASWALVATACVGALGTALFVSTSISSDDDVNSCPAPSDWLGPIRSAPLRVLYAAMACVGVTIGALTPLAVEAADRLSAPGLAGGLPAALSSGAVLGGLVYGARSWPGSITDHLITLSAVFAAGWIPLTVAESPATAVSCAALPGLAMAPLLCTGFVMTSTLAPSGQSTEAHALLVAFLDIGCATGTAIAGPTPTQLLLPAGAAGAALILTTAKGHLGLAPSSTPDLEAQEELSVSPFLITRNQSLETTDAALRADVLHGLTRTPKTLPPKWSYDAHGSGLFEKITELPEYYPARAERELLIAHSTDIAAATGARTLIELGSGSSQKTQHLLDALADLDTYVPVDVSENALTQAGNALVGQRPGLNVHALIADFTTGLTLPGTPGPRLLAFLGSTIGNLLPRERATLLSSIRSLLAPGDALLLGTDLVKDQASLIAAYDDDAGVTAAFNKNVLSVINRRLGADFDLGAFEHVVRWDADNEWIEMRLRSRTDQTVKIPALGLAVAFTEGEELRTEVSAKFRQQVVRRELALWEMELTHWWTAGQLYGLALAQPAAAPRPAQGR